MNKGLSHFRHKADIEKAGTSYRLSDHSRRHRHIKLCLSLPVLAEIAHDLFDDPEYRFLLLEAARRDGQGESRADLVIISARAVCQHLVYGNRQR